MYIAAPAAVACAALNPVLASGLSAVGGTPPLPSRNPGAIVLLLLLLFLLPLSLPLLLCLLGSRFSSRLLSFCQQLICCQLLRLLFCISACTRELRGLGQVF